MMSVNRKWVYLTFHCMIGAMLIAAPALAEQKSAISIDNIIDNVRRNEDLYKNIDVTMNDHYDIGDRKPEAFNAEFMPIVKKDRTFHFVCQDEKFRLEREGTQVSADGTTNNIVQSRIRAFDGEMTRLLDQRAVGNIITGPSNDPYFVKPHMFLIRHNRWMASLSTWLKGHDALAADPSGQKDLDSKVRLRTTYQGVADFQGLRCHKIWLTLFFKSNGEQGTRRELWLAEDRNYIPARVISWSPRESEDIPNAEGAVSEWREIKPGVWFPMAATYTRYNPSLLRQKGKQELQWRTEYTVKKVSLDPKYDISFFQDVDFPDGTAVYEIENGKITQSYRIGAPD